MPPEEMDRAAIERMMRDLERPSLAEEIWSGICIVTGILILVGAEHWWRALHERVIVYLLFPIMLLSAVKWTQARERSARTWERLVELRHEAYARQRGTTTGA